MEKAGVFHDQYGMSAKQIETALKAMAGGTALEGNAQSAKIESYILDKIANRHRTYTTVAEDTTPTAQQPQQEQAWEAAPGREPLDRVIAETLGQNQDQQQTPAAVDTPQEVVEPANAALDKVTNATIAEGSVKSQIRRSQETLNAMDAVAEIQTPSQFSAMDQSQKINWVVDKLKPTNYEVDRKGFGVIKFAKKQLKSAFNYFTNGGSGGSDLSGNSLCAPEWCGNLFSCRP